MSGMRKWASAAGLAVLMFAGVLQWATGREGAGENADAMERSAAAFVGDRSIQYRINSFTSPEPPSAGSLTAPDVPADARLAARSESLELYVSEGAKRLFVKDRRSGYVWTSSPEEAALAEGGLNDEWKSALSSPFLIEYFDENAMLRRGSYDSLGGTTASVEAIAGGIRAVYALEAVGVTFAMEVKLEGDALVVRLPDRDIAEDGRAKLASIQPLPFFGTVRNNEVPGYLFIPDGSGALIRFQDMHPRYDHEYVGRIYGVDVAVEHVETESVNEQPVLMPVFGIVHGAGDNAFVGVVEDGKYNARIVAYPSGVNTDYYWIAPKFMLRFAYFQPTSKNMGGFNTYQKERDRQDRRVRYVFLHGDEADYVGMAKAYRRYLQERHVLAPLAGARENIPLSLEVLGADKEPGLLGSRLVKMTTFAEAGEIVDQLLKAGIRDISLVIRGWNRGGIHGSNPDKFPAERRLGGNDGLAELKRKLAAEGVPVYLYTDYTIAYGSNGNFSPKTDGIRSAGNRVMEFTRYLRFDRESGGDLDFWFIRPDKAKRIAEADARQFGKIGIDSIAVERTSWLLSDHHPERRTSRQQAAELSRQVAETLLGAADRLAFYLPPDYLWPYADQMLHMPLYSSQYMFATDTVPFMQIVLHGFVDYFAPHANYSANPREYLLRMVEYGAYPSYIVTKEPSWKLKNTLSNSLYTSQFEDWKDEIKTTYAKMNAALQKVQYAAIERRTVPDWGVVEVAYSNGVRIIVNYREQPYRHGGLTVPAEDFAIAGGE